jgi:hypothetical protein
MTQHKPGDRPLPPAVPPDPDTGDLPDLDKKDQEGKYKLDPPINEENADNRHDE